jgi:hypothetical protein
MFTVNVVAFTKFVEFTVMPGFENETVGVPLVLLNPVPVIVMTWFVAP